MQSVRKADVAYNISCLELGSSLVDYVGEQTLALREPDVPGACYTVPSQSWNEIVEHMYAYWVIS